MNLNSSKHPPLDIDAVLQDTYLLVVELRQGAWALDDQSLWQLCVKQVESVRQSLEQAGLALHCIDHISHAQCALLDETVLTCTTGNIHSRWTSEPLQARFFNTHQAGESLFEDMREVLRGPAPDPQVLRVFQRVLMLGFQGRYRDAADPEREQLLANLTAQVAPLQAGQGLTLHAGNGRCRIGLPGIHSSLAHVLVMILVLFGVWWGLDHLLGVMIASLLSAQV